jgi:integrase/recombinase XerC/integrase/recombinase XerD
MYLQAPTQNALKSTNSGVNEALQAFIKAQDIKANSADLYRRTLKQFFNWVTAQGLTAGELTHPNIIEYKAYLLKDGKSPLTVGGYITAVRRFYEWAEANKYYPNIAKNVKNPRRIQQFRKQSLTPKQCEQLLDYTRLQSLRDYALTNLLLRTGLRTIEAIRLNIGDIEPKGERIVLKVHGKGREEKDAFVILSDKALTPLLAYIATRPGAKDSEPMFISTSNRNQSERLTTRTISSTIKNALIGIGLNSKFYTAHSLRHTTAVSILRAGASIEHAQGVLRHTSPATTQIYTATIKEEQRLIHATELMLDNVF